MRTEKRRIGDIGEELACRFLVKRGFKIVERNYLKKWGEIDIIARRSGQLHFVEVKTVQSKVANQKSKDVSRETGGYRPEENVHPSKLKRLSRAIQTYLSDRHLSDNAPWQIDVVTVRLDLDGRQAKVKTIEDVVM